MEASGKGVVATDGGSPRVADDPGLLAASSEERVVTAGAGGVIQSIDALDVGLASVDLGVGRARMDDEVDLSAGIIFSAKVGDRVEAGAPLARIVGRDRARVERCAARIEAIVRVGEAEVDVDGELFRLGAGDSIVIPGGKAHSFSNPGDTPLMLVAVLGPRTP